MNKKSGSERGELTDKIVSIIENLSTHILHYHDKEGRTTNEQVIHKARFREVAEAVAVEFSHLQKLCEEQKGHISSWRGIAKKAEEEKEKAVTSLGGNVSNLRAEIDRKEDLILSLKAQVEEQKGELAELKAEIRTAHPDGQLFERGDLQNPDGSKITEFDYLGAVKFLGKEFNASIWHECDPREIEFVEDDGEIRELEYVIGDGEEYNSPSGYVVKEPHPKIEQLESQLAEQKAEVERLKRQVAMTQTKWTEDLVKEGRVAVLTAQLATQTERVRVMREALQFYSNRSLWSDCEQNGFTKYNTQFNDPNGWKGFVRAEQALNQESLGDGGKGK